MGSNFFGGSQHSQIRNGLGQYDPLAMAIFGKGNSYDNPGLTSTYTGTAPSVAGANSGYGAAPSWFPSQNPTGQIAPSTPRVTQPSPVMGLPAGGFRGV